MKTPATRSDASLVAAGPPPTRLVLAGKMLPLHRQRASTQRGRLGFEPSSGTFVTIRALPMRARPLPRSTHP